MNRALLIQVFVGVLWCGLALSCDRAQLRIGETCELNSDCDEPLACRLDRCRTECIDSRDCGAGLSCLSADQNDGGGCQLPDERNCALDSDCGESLVCRFNTCTTECAEDRDCVDGAQCDTTDDGGRACVEPTQELCIYNSDCPEPFVCGADQQCDFECVEDRDCPRPRICENMLCELPDVAP